MQPIIEVNHVWKEYPKGIDRRYKSLRDSIAGIPGRFFGERKEKFWALEDIDFKVEAGESIGIIGRNGAGKSTLLKILSRITPPTKGEIILRGRVASLLEVGTGFHPELTGRENIFFNGSILGMKNFEIKKKFDEIVDFSGVESFIDTPLKHFSSGMQMRLAFSVAAHLDSEILLIDEVLAVGDAEFQKKCIGKMDDVCKGDGKTIMFVSHDIQKILSITHNSILLDKATITFSGISQKVCNHYRNTEAEMIVFKEIQSTNAYLKIKKIQFKNQFPKLWLNLQVSAIKKNQAFKIVVGINSQNHDRLLTYLSDVITLNSVGGKLEFHLDLDNLYLRDNYIGIKISILNEFEEINDTIEIAKYELPFEFSVSNKYLGSVFRKIPKVKITVLNH